MVPTDTSVSHFHTNTIRRGFNLVEAAIVLGVIGLVIGGIWTAASAVQRNMKLNELVTLISTINSNLQSLYATNRPSEQISIQGNLLRNVVPNSHQLSNSNQAVAEPFGGNMTVDIENTNIIYALHLPNPTSEENKTYCFTIATKLLTSFSAIGFSDFDTGGDRFLQEAGGDYDLSTIDAINTNCVSGDGIRLRLRY